VLKCAVIHSFINRIKETDVPACRELRGVTSIIMIIAFETFFVIICAKENMYVCSNVEVICSIDLFMLVFLV
jgi:hypothetical protein